MSPRILPTVMIALAALASARYGIARDWSQTVYWAAAAALNFAVTWMR